MTWRPHHSASRRIACWEVTRKLDSSSTLIRKFRQEDSTVNIYFSSTPRYFIHHCLSQTYHFTTSLPPETDKVWKITLSRVSGIRLVIHCNDVDVLNMVISDSTCRTYDFWNTYWSRNMKKIYFNGDDTASDFYSKFNHRSPPIEGEPNEFIASTLYALIIKDVSQFLPIKFNLIKQLHCVSPILKI